MIGVVVIAWPAVASSLKTSPWNAPPGGWDYTYDPDAGSPENLEQDGWVSNNASDQYVFQPKTADGQTFANVAFIDDGAGGKCLRLYDPGDTRNAPYKLSDPSGRKISISKDLGAVQQVTVAFRIRSVGFTDNYGVQVPAGYASEYVVPIIGVRINRSESAATGVPLSGAGIYIDPAAMNVLSFPNPGTAGDTSSLPTNKDIAWNHAEWHEYWITYDISGGGEFKLYVDGKVVPKFPAMGLEAGARTQDIEADMPAGNLAILIWLGGTSYAGTVQIDWIAAKVGKFSPTVGSGAQGFEQYR
jgi:hypothetical protein